MLHLDGYVKCTPIQKVKSTEQPVLLLYNTLDYINLYRQLRTQMCENRNIQTIKDVFIYIVNTSYYSYLGTRLNQTHIRLGQMGNIFNINAPPNVQDITCIIYVINPAITLYIFKMRNFYWKILKKLTTTSIVGRS